MSPEHVVNDIASHKSQSRVAHYHVVSNHNHDPDHDLHLVTLLHHPLCDCHDHGVIMKLSHS